MRGEGGAVSAIHVIILHYHIRNCCYHIEMGLAIMADVFVYDIIRLRSYSVPMSFATPWSVVRGPASGVSGSSTARGLRPACAGASGMGAVWP